MEKSGRTGKLAGLIIAVVVIAILVALVGMLCTCTCTCRRCLDGIEWLSSPDDPPEATSVPTPAPTAVSTPAHDAATNAPTHGSPFDEEKPPAPQDPSAWVRPKQVQLKNDGTDTVTVLVYMNGSDLESEYGEATEDLAEMVRADKSDRVNILVETLGTRKWDNRFGISARHAQRYRVMRSGLKLLDDSLGQLDTTLPATLSDFIRWGAKTCPADRYILLLWDHGGGPVYGFGYDEYQPYTASLTIDEMQTALRDGGIYFDMIGMDCCLMSSLEVCTALYDHCDYTLLSEDFEPGCGWAHEGWLSALANDPAIETEALAKIAIDDSIRAAQRLSDEDGGMTLALLDESYVALLCPAWIGFAYENEDALLSLNYSQLRQSTGRAHPRISRAVGSWDYPGNSELDDYCITDMLSLAENIDSSASDALCAALNKTVVYFNATADETTFSGLSVTLPYGDAAFYQELRRVFTNAGIDEAYVTWLGKFVSVGTQTDYYDFGGWNVWDDWDEGGYDWSGWFDGQNGWDDWSDSGYDIGDLMGWLFGA